MLILDEVRCPECGRKLMELCGQARVKCPKCKAMVFADSSKRKPESNKEVKYET